MADDSTVLKGIIARLIEVTDVMGIPTSTKDNDGQWLWINLDGTTQAMTEQEAAIMAELYQPGNMPSGT